MNTIPTHPSQVVADQLLAADRLLEELHAMTDEQLIAALDGITDTSVAYAIDFSSPSSRKSGKSRMSRAQQFKSKTSRLKAARKKELSQRTPVDPAGLVSGLSEPYSFKHLFLDITSPFQNWSLFH